VGANKKVERAVVEGKKVYRRGTIKFDASLRGEAGSIKNFSS
jgi:hypothetical protein